MTKRKVESVLCTPIICTDYLFGLWLFWFFSLLRFFEVIENQYFWSRIEVVIRVCLNFLPFMYVNLVKAELNQIGKPLKVSICMQRPWHGALCDVHPFCRDLLINSSFILAACTQLLPRITE